MNLKKEDEDDRKDALHHHNGQKISTQHDMTLISLHRNAIKKNNTLEAPHFHGQFHLKQQAKAMEMAHRPTHLPSIKPTQPPWLGRFREYSPLARCRQLPQQRNITPASLARVPVRCTLGRIFHPDHLYCSVLVLLISYKTIRAVHLEMIRNAFHLVILRRRPGNDTALPGMVLAKSLVCLILVLYEASANLNGYFKCNWIFH